MNIAYLERLKRIKKEYKDFNEKTNFSATSPLIQFPNEEDITNWEVTVFGPSDTSYKKGLFCLSINFPDGYPHIAPEVRFLTPIYHVNVNSKVPSFPDEKPLGHIYLPILNDWKPEYTMYEVITYIYILFYKVNPDHPYSLDKVNEFNNNRSLYEEKIKKFTKKYANCMDFKNYPKNQNWDFSL
jgi:ubiquitin-conjugating enzyme E2 D/E